MSIQKFSRYEFKYLMTESMASEIEREVSHFMDYDGYVHPEMGNRYTVRSLYFENEQLSNFNEKVDGVKKEGNIDFVHIQVRRTIIFQYSLKRKVGIIKGHTKIECK